MIELAELDSLPPQQNQALLIKVRYESDNTIFNFEIEQSVFVQELIDEMRRQLSIPDKQHIMLKQGQNKLEENRSFSSFEFPNEVLIDIIIEDSYQTTQEQHVIDKEIIFVIIIPQKNKKLNVKMIESTKIIEVIDSLIPYVGNSNDIQITHGGQLLNKYRSLRDHLIQEGAELIVILR